MLQVVLLAPTFAVAAKLELPASGLASLETRLAEYLVQAKSSWPDLALDEAAFATHLGERAESVDGLARLHVSDLYLACACLYSLDAALAAFERAYFAGIAVHVRRYDSAESFVDDVRQVLRERFFVWVDGVAPRIVSFTGRGALGAWVRVAAVRVALRLTEQQRAPAPTMESALTTDPELDYVRSRYKSSFSQALTEGLATLSPEERSLLRLHFVDGLTIDGLAPFFGVHRATAARRLAEARERLLDATRTRISALLGVSGRELDSLLALVRSRIDLNLSQLFASR